MSQFLLSTGTDCPEKLWNLCPWSCSKAVWTQFRATWSRWPLGTGELDKMTSRCPYRLQPFCDPVNVSLVPNRRLSFMGEGQQWLLHVVYGFWDYSHLSYRLPGSSNGLQLSVVLGAITHLAGQGASPPRVHPITSRLAREGADSLPRAQVIRHLQGDKASLRSSQKVKPEIRNNKVLDWAGDYFPSSQLRGRGRELMAQGWA